MPNDKATAFALILEANISGRRRAGTGPAPREKDNTQLHKWKDSKFKYPGLDWEKEEMDWQREKTHQYDKEKYQLTEQCQVQQGCQSMVPGHSK